MKKENKRVECKFCMHHITLRFHIILKTIPTFTGVAHWPLQVYTPAR